MPFTKGDAEAAENDLWTISIGWGVSFRINFANYNRKTSYFFFLCLAGWIWVRGGETGSRRSWLPWAIFVGSGRAGTIGKKRHLSPCNFSLLVAGLAEGGGEPLETLVQTVTGSGAGGLDVLLGGEA